MLSQALNISAGLTGLISLSQAGFYGIGAYTAAILSTKFGFPFLINLPIALIICGVISSVISYITLRTVEDYFIISTLGIQVLIFSFLYNFANLTRGALGIVNIPSLELFGYKLNSPTAFLIVPVLFTLIIWFLLHNLSRSSFGKTLIAINEDEIYTSSIGKNVLKSKRVSFTISAVVAAIPGVLFAHYYSYIDPTSFGINESILILSIVIIGGLGNLTGSFFASCFIVLLPQALTFLGLSDNIAANMRLIIYGVILILLMIVGKTSFISLFKKQNGQT